MKSASVLILIAMMFFMSLMGASCPKQGNNISQGNGDKQLYAQAEDMFESGDYAEAQKIYQKIIEEYPLSGWSEKSQFRLGQIYYKEGDIDEALAEFKRFSENNRDDEQADIARDYIIQIMDKKYKDLEQEYAVNMSGLEQQNYRYEELNKYLRRSVDNEVIYLELDLNANRLFVKLGTQTLYEYPMVSGKGRRRLQTTGAMKDFSTPKGIRQVEHIVKNPKWYRPDWYWLERGEELPEELTMEDRAVEGTLGPYKVVLGEGYAIHGTRRGKIRPGKYSHGCIRMNNKDLKQMVKLIDDGTLVFIY